MIYDQIAQTIPPIPTAQETPVPRIAAAKEAADRASAALDGLLANPLAELIAEHGIGASLSAAQAETGADLMAAYERSVQAHAGAQGAAGGFLDGLAQQPAFRRRQGRPSERDRAIRASH